MIIRTILLIVIYITSTTIIGSNNLKQPERKIELIVELTKEDSLIKELSLFLTTEQVDNWITIAKLESGVCLNSEGAMSYNNYFGLSYNRSLIRFNSLRECVLFLKTLLCINPKLLSTNHYVFAKELINFGWAEDPLYYNKYIYLRKYLYEHKQKTSKL